MPAFAQKANSGAQVSFSHDVVRSIRMSEQAPVKAQLNDGTVANINRAKASEAKVQWKRPAGQFWGVGYDPETNQIGYLYTPLVIRPWTEYTFENISTVSGTPSWMVTSWDNNAEQYVVDVTDEKNVEQSWLLGEMCAAPLLSYENQAPYAAQYNGKVLTDMKQQYLCVAKDIESSFWGAPMPVSSHYWGPFTRNKVERNGFMYITGAEVYEGQDPDYGMWFGTNNSGINALATRFEKPDQPYLLNGVYFYYQYFTDIKNELPVKAYVFKTENDAEVVQVNDSVSKERAVLGDLIAVAESVIPKAVSSDDSFQNAVRFDFYEVDPVTGQKTAVSLEIEDDIIIVVTGFNADPGEGCMRTTFLSTDTFDEGYGNLGFMGYLEIGEDGTLDYELTALHNAFRSPLDNTTVGVLADVSYPWLMPYYIGDDNDILLPNEGDTNYEEGFQGLQYEFPFMTTSTLDEIEVEFNGEEECDWFTIIYAEDIMDENEEGEEEFSGICDIVFQADPNPDDIDRTCVVKLSIPAASYELTFRQGSNNQPDAVEVVKVDGNAEYYDLQGRRVANPQKGLYIKKSGNKATKVIL